MGTEITDSRGSMKGARKRAIGRKSNSERVQKRRLRTEKLDEDEIAELHGTVSAMFFSRFSLSSSLFSFPDFRSSECALLYRRCFPTMFALFHSFLATDSAAVTFSARASVSTPTDHGNIHSAHLSAQAHRLTSRPRSCLSTALQFLG